MAPKNQMGHDPLFYLGPDDKKRVGYRVYYDDLGVVRYRTLFDRDKAEMIAAQKVTLLGLFKITVERQELPGKLSDDNSKARLGPSAALQSRQKCTECGNELAGGYCVVLFKAGEDYGAWVHTRCAISLHPELF